jgi:uric acid-xanthine permease
MLCSLLNMGLSFAPAKTLKRIFPPVVTGTVIVMIGASLIGQSGVLNWAGGSNGCQDRPTSGIFQLCPTIFSPRAAQWGSPQFIGLGFLSFITILVCRRRRIHATLVFRYLIYLVLLFSLLSCSARRS